jgi:hypothetical protein
MVNTGEKTTNVNSARDGPERICDSGMMLVDKIVGDHCDLHMIQHPLHLFNNVVTSSEYIMSNEGMISG